MYGLLGPETRGRQAIRGEVWMSDKQRSPEEVEKMVDEFMEVMGKRGNKKGERIAGVAAELHPDALLIVPLYRSAVVVLPKNEEEQERGSMSLVLYHDPQWLGADDITTENLPRFKHVLQIWGQRSGPDVSIRTQDTDEIAVLDTEWGWEGRKEAAKFVKELAESKEKEGEE